MTITYSPIGVIHTPFTQIKNVPIQPTAALGTEGMIELDTQYIDGLKDLDGFSHIILIYHFHLSKDYKLNVTPFLDQQIHGVFATRAPKRPNPIGLSVVRLVRIERHIIHVKNVDIVDGTPLLDIKPYVPEFNNATNPKIGWLSKNITDAANTKADERFK
jgi:tRNA-Thr(GGU) m(6)t(6)A37 methyltransferase TsaA